MSGLVRLLAAALLLFGSAVVYIVLTGHGISDKLAMVVCVVPAAILIGLLQRRKPPKQAAKGVSRAATPSAPAPARAPRSSSPATERSLPAAPSVPQAPADVVKPKEPTQAEAIIKAGDFFYKIAVKAAHIGGGVHAETLVIACSWMAGTMLFRSFPLQVGAAPGTAVFSDQANEAGPKLMDFLFTSLRQFGHKLSEQSVMAAQDARALSTKVAGFTLLEAQRKLDPFFFTYCKASSLSHREAAFAAIIATATAINVTRQVLDPNKAAALAIHALVEGCKTQPIPFTGPQAAAVQGTAD